LPMSYISLYRKYRSQTFDEIVGQSHITTTLKNAIERNRISHAYLFSGPRGTGKTSTARILAKSLNCEKGPTPVPCNECDICLAIAKDALFDVIEIDAASNRGIDDIRDLREKVRIPPVQSRFKVYIIDEVHMLTREASNALLKTLEEPPKHVIFIMATTEPQKMLATILSRCQRFDFRRLSDGEIGNHIRSISEKENFKIEDGALATVVKSADGSLRDAISILDQLVSFSDGAITAADVNQVFGLPERHEIAKLMDTVFSGDVEGAFEIFNAFFSAGKSFNLFVRFLMEYFRDLYLIKQGIRPSSEVYTDEELRPLKRQAGAVTREALVGMLDEVARVEDRIRWETYPRIVLEILLIHLVDKIAGPRLSAGEQPAAFDPVAHIERPAASAPEPRQPRRAEPHASELVAEQQPKKSSVAPNAEEPEPAKQVRETPIPPPAPATAVPPKPEFEEPRLGPVSDPELQSVRDVWPSVLSKIKEENLPMYFLIAAGVPAALAGGTLTLEFDSSHKFHMEKAAEEKYLKVIESAVAAAAGRELRVNVRAAGNGSEETVQAPPAPNGTEVPADETARREPEKRSAQNLSLFDVLSQEFPDSREVK